MTTKIMLRPWDAAEHLQTEEDIAAYLEAAAEENDPALLAVVLGDVARARNMSQLARDAGITREGLYKAFSAGGNPSFATVAKLAGALGLRVSFKPAKRSAKAKRTASANPRRTAKSAANRKPAVKAKSNNTASAAKRRKVA